MTEQISAITPFPVALLVCDSVITDEKNKKKTLVGVFDRIRVEKFPAAHLSLTLYARLTDAEGNYEFRVDYVRVKTDEVLAQGKMPAINLADRLGIVELIFNPPPILIPAPGQYEFRLWANNRYVGRVGFTVEKSQTGDQI